MVNIASDAGMAKARWTKRALNNWLKTAGPIFDQSAAYEMLCFLGPDVLEGVAALQKKRPPKCPSAAQQP